MPRFEFAVAVAAVVGGALTGCSLAPNWAPDWMSSKSSEQLQTLNFESEPPGAMIRTTQGQTCITPCGLTVPSQEQPVKISRAGYKPQMVQVKVGPQPDHSFWEKPPPALVPNPVRVVMQAESASKPAHGEGHRRSVSKARTVAKIAAASNGVSRPSPDPPPAQSEPLPNSSSPFPSPQQGAVNCFQRFC